MSNKKSVGLIILIVVVVVGALWLKNHKWSRDTQHNGVVISSWNSGMGAVDENTTNLDKQKLTFTATIWNDSTEQTYVKDVNMKLPNSLRSHVLSGDTVLHVNQLLDPNANYQIEGELILDTKGMTKQEIINLGSIQGFTVESENK